MFRIVLLQGLATAVVALIAGLIGGVHALLSAFLGGLACVVPNALFAWRLIMQAHTARHAGVGTFFVGELIKLVATVALLFATARLYSDLNWLALLAGFIVALKSYFVAFLLDSRR